VRLTVTPSGNGQRRESTASEAGDESAAVAAAAVAVRSTTITVNLVTAAN
jgi:hypothetical protein